MFLNPLKRLSGALLLLLLVFGPGCRMSRTDAPLAHRGVLNLERCDLEQGDSVPLDGEWAFHGGQLLVPADFRGQTSPSPSGYLALPSTWNGTGHATLRLSIRVGPGHSPLALRVSDIHSAYRLWVNGRLEAESGRVAQRAEEEIPDPSVRVVPIHDEGSPIELILQISNFHFRDGGVPASLRLGREDAVHAGQNRHWGLAMLFCGSLLVMGVYHLALHAFRRADSSPLHFGLYCLLWMGNILGADSSDWVIRLFLPGLSAEFLYRANLICYFLTLPVGYRFFRSLYPQEFPAWILRTFWILAAVCGSMALGVSTRLLSETLLIHYMASIAVILFALSGLQRAWRRGREGAAIILLGFLVLGCTGINDMLHDLRLIHTGYVIHVGLFVFILSQAMALSLRFSRAFSAVEDLSAELVHKNVILEEEMAERLRLEREIVQVSEEERCRISHELHDGLCQQLTGARLRCSVLERKWPKDGEGASELAQLSSILEASVDQAYDLSHGLWPTEREPKDVCTSLAGLARSSSASSGIAVEFQQKRLCETCSNDHVTQLYHIAQESIANALKHARPTRILVTLDCLSHHTVTLSVRDDGVGRRAAKKTKGGLGLRIMAHRARMLGGIFRVEDAEDRGTIVTCSVPCEGRRIKELP